MEFKGPHTESHLEAVSRSPPLELSVAVVAVFGRKWAHRASDSRKGGLAPAEVSRFGFPQRAQQKNAPFPNVSQQRLRPPTQRVTIDSTFDASLAFSRGSLARPEPREARHTEKQSDRNRGEPVRPPNPALLPLSRRLRLGVEGSSRKGLSAVVATLRCCIGKYYWRYWRGLEAPC